MNTDSNQLAEGQPAPSPTLIPLHNEYSSSSSSGGLPEWAMIELNGELMAPSPKNPPHQNADKENPAQSNDAADSLLRNDHIELGSVRFVDNVSVDLDDDDRGQPTRPIAV